MNQQPTFSIITITYNAERWLERTILSVLSQSYPNIEYILIDGASKDKTVEIIKQYESGIASWISEPDKGLYDAMNKGLKRATGDYVCFLNAGDTLYTADTVRRLKAPEKLTWKSFRMGMLVCHQSFISKREIAPLYNTEYRLTADYDWCIQCLRRSKRIHNTRLILSNFLEEGLSSVNRKASLKERYEVMCKYYGKVSTILLHGWFAVRFYFAKWFKGRV